MDNNAYYSQSALWGKAPERYQLQSRVDILSMIPADSGDILDVGCGDGFVTNAIPGGIKTVGMDISAEALRLVNRRKFVGSVSALPFADSSFGLVMSNDVIEHLPEAIYGKAVSEIFRVASRYVLITVPYGEQLEKSFAECARCGSVYHINNHYRSFLEKELESVCPEGWEILEMRYSGDFTRPPFDPAAGISNEFKMYGKFGNCVCPECGSTETVSKERESIKKVLRNMSAERMFSSDLASQHANRTELITLFHKKGQGKTLKKEYPLPETVNGSILEGDTGNTLQVKEGFTEGFFWTSVSKDGEGSFTFQFPVIAKEGDRVEMEASDGIKEGDFSVSVFDPLKGVSFDLSCIETKGLSAVYGVPAAAPGIFGTTVQISSKSVNSLKKATYKPAKGNASFPFVVLKPGHNVLANDKGKYVRSWGLWMEKAGLFPKPVWLWNGALEARGGTKTEFPEFIDELQRFYDDLKEQEKGLYRLLESKEKAREGAEAAYRAVCARIDELNSILESKERARENAESAYRAVCARIDELNSILESKEQARENAESAYRAASQKINDLIPFERKYKNIINSRVSRVLVISHMFPNEHQKNLGCFVAEQVKALRDYGMDCRVISCQPFWHNSKNPAKLPGCFRHYGQAVDSSSWFKHEGIPTLFIPYLVGHPYFTYRLYFLTYYRAIASVIDKAHRDFRFDLIHAHTGYMDGFAGMMLAKKYNVPLVITEHTGPFSLLTEKLTVRKITVKSLSSADKVICVSKSLEDEVKRWVPSEHHHKFTVVPNGIDPALFYHEKKNVSSGNGHRLLSVISLDDNKNPFCLLEAFKILSSNRRDFTLDIIGDGPLREKINKWIAGNGLEDKISLLGWRTREEVARFMRNECDIFVLPSKTETFGVVVAEAMASGKPVVSTRCGGPESIITEPFLGELCENDAPASMAEKIIKVASNPGFYKPEMISGHAFKKFSFERIAADLYELYQGIAK